MWEVRNPRHQLLESQWGGHIRAYLKYKRESILKQDHLSRENYAGSHLQDAVTPRPARSRLHIPTPLSIIIKMYRSVEGGYCLTVWSGASGVRA